MFKPSKYLYIITLCIFILNAVLVSSCLVIDYDDPTADIYCIGNICKDRYNPASIIYCYGSYCVDIDDHSRRLYRMI